MVKRLLPVKWLNRTFFKKKQIMVEHDQISDGKSERHSGLQGEMQAANNVFHRCTEQESVSEHCVDLWNKSSGKVNIAILLRHFTLECISVYACVRE